MTIHNLDIYLDKDNNIDKVKLNPNIDGQVVFYSDNYISEDEMYKDISDFTKMMLKYGNTCKVYLDDTNIVVVQFGHDEDREAWGSPKLEWITEEEAELLEDYRESVVSDVMSYVYKDVEQCKNMDGCTCCDTL